jgi:uncharacterized RDD family membrane protein YckC
VHDPVVTPEAVALDLETATVGSRSVAIALDLALIGTGLLLLGLAEAAFGFGGFVPDWFGIALVLLLAFSLQFGYPIGFETLWRGRTPGKAAMGLRVVTVEGAPVRFRHAATRAALGLIELTGTAGAVAVVASLSSRRSQRLGDMAAGTLVIRERRSGRPPRAVPFEPPPGLEGYVRVLDTSRLDRADYATVRDLLRRDLAPDLRARLGEQVAGGLVARVQPPPPPGVDAVTWLQCVAAAVQRRQGTGGPTSEGTGRPARPVPGDGAGHAAAGPGAAGAYGTAPPGPTDEGEPGPPPPPSAAGGERSGPGGTGPSPRRPGGFAPPE